MYDYRALVTPAIHLANPIKYWTGPTPSQGSYTIPTYFQKARDRLRNVLVVLVPVYILSLLFLCDME